MDNFSKYLKYLFRVVVVGYTLIAMYYFLNKPFGSGDESLFISDLDFISESGWIAAIKKGISIPYMLIVYPIAKLITPALALRIVNIVLFVVLLLYFRYYRHIKTLDFYFLLLFFFSSLGYFMVGTNDTLFIVCMSVFFAESHFTLQNNSEKTTVLWGLSLVLAFFTRELLILFVPIVILIVFVLLKQRKFSIKALLVPFIIALGFTALNYPSIVENQKLSYDAKTPPESINATWAQRQYLAQLWVNEGKLKNYNHPTWEQTDNYLKTNGAESLPNSVFSSLTFDIKLTLKEFKKDFIYILKYSVRSMGLMVLIVLIIGFKYFLRITSFRLNKNTLIPSLLFISICIFSMIIISFIELRWLASVFIATIVFFHLKTEKQQIPKFWVLANFILIALLCIYGSYGLILKM